MLGKLMKFEYRSSMRFMAVIWAALVASAVMLGIMGIITRNVGTSLYGNGIVGVISAVVTLLYGLSCAALVASTIIVIVIRFYKGLLGDEGYLMHTLPVTTRQLITSKGLVAASVVLISILVAGLSVFIITTLLDAQVMGQFLYALSQLPSEISKHIGWGKFLLLVIEGIVLSIGLLLAWIYKIYAALSIGQLVDKHRILLSLAAFIGFDVAFGMITGIIGVIGSSVQLDYAINTSNWFVRIQLPILLFLVIEAIIILIYHIISELLLSKKLNLQ